MYLLSGLGADSRAFKNLTLPVGYVPVHINYIEPLPKESLQQYALRLIDQMDISKPFSIIGLSFGGIITMELLELLQPVKTILISSVSNKKELPILYRLAGSFKLNKLIPSNKVNKPNFLTYYIFGIKLKEHQILLKEILTSTNTKFSQWAVNEIVNWKRKKHKQNFVRIHGTKDRLLPIKNFTPDYTIKNGGHLLIIQNGEAVSNIVQKILLG
jgi:hypothetical protein